MTYKIPLIKPEEISLERIKKMPTGPNYEIKCRILKLSVPGFKKEIEKKQTITMSNRELTTRMGPAALFDSPIRNYWDAKICMMKSDIFLYGKVKENELRHDDKQF